MDLPLAFRIKSPSPASSPEKPSIAAVLNEHDGHYIAMTHVPQHPDQRAPASSKDLAAAAEALKNKSKGERINHIENEYEQYVINKIFSRELLDAVTKSDPITPEVDVSKQDIRNRIEDLNTQIKLMRDDLEKVEARLPPRRRPRLLDFDPMQRRYEVMEELKVARRLLCEWIADVEAEWRILARRLVSKDQRI